MKALVEVEQHTPSKDNKRKTPKHKAPKQSTLNKLVGLIKDEHPAKKTKIRDVIPYVLPIKSPNDKPNSSGRSDYDGSKLDALDFDDESNGKPLSMLLQK